MGLQEDGHDSASVTSGSASLSEGEGEVGSLVSSVAMGSSGEDGGLGEQRNNVDPLEGSSNPNPNPITLTLLP